MVRARGTARDRPSLPWELIGWCGFASVVAAVVLVLLGERPMTALLVLGTGVATVGVIVTLALVAPRSGASSGSPPDPL